MTVEVSRELFDTADEHQSRTVAKPGVHEEIVRFISKTKQEPEWMLAKRLKGLALFEQTALPTWGPDLSQLDLNSIIYFVDPNTSEKDNWEDVPAEIKKTFDRLGIPEAEKSALAGVGAQYDCLTEDTLIPTNPQGMIKIKNLKEGDDVFAWDEKKNSIVKAKVKDVRDKGILPVFEVKVRGKMIKATYNHPFLALVDRRKKGRQRARYSKEWRYLNELKKGDIIAIATDLPDFGKPFKFLKAEVKEFGKGRNQFGSLYNLPLSYKYKKVTFPTESDNNLMWLFGFFLGDGYITKSKKSDKMRLNFAAYDGSPEVRTKIKEIIKEYFDYDITTQDKFRLSINSTKIASFFKNNGFTGNAHTKKIPSWVNSLPKEQKLSLLAGYIDSDGTVRKKEKDAVVTSVNYNLLGQIKELCVYCGLDS